MNEAFGFDQEIMLIYSRFKTVEPRAIQAAEAFIAEEPARGRVEKLTYFFISEDPQVEDWFHSYTSVNQESRLIIPIYAEELRTHKTDAWFIRNHIEKHLYGRDLYDYRLPLEKDTYFFGRSNLVINLFDAIKRAENRAIFGLRKTGKTSLLFKLERMLKADNVAEVVYLDCKLPSIRKLRWNELYEKICKELISISKQHNNYNYDEIHVADAFINIVATLSKPVLLVFDEIEYISPISIEDSHWKRDFLAFWQTFWACQSRFRKVCAMIAGVNPYVVEIDTIDGVQNPLFGIVSYQYLTGLNQEETRNMIRTLGKRMGLKFDLNALNYMHQRYGGHPLLTRIACSILNNIAKSKGDTRPINITVARLEKEEETRDSELVFYCRHVVSELKQFYPDEYAMLELLASGQVNDFVELAAYPEFTKHLKAYGLLTEDNFKRPIIGIPVIKRYVGLELAQKEGRQTLLRIIPQNEREQWIAKRKISIVQDIRMLEKAIDKTGNYSLFGPNSFPEADQFMNLKICSTDDDFKLFINKCNRCFVESIENYGKSIGLNQYYWKEIKIAYPGIWYALQRIKIYRHEQMHILLTSQASTDLLTYLKQDLEGRNPSSVREVYFILQQCVLDNLLTGIQIEFSRLN
jgi:hypothetical protein